jgi:hypothetical protein
MSDEELQKIEKTKLPWFYRLILKIPGANFLEGTSSGVFWILVVPFFLASEFFTSLLLLIFLPFPINLVLASLIPAVVLLVFIRINLERFINWWNGNFGKPFEWNMEKTLHEYLASLKKKNEEKNK